MAKRTEMLRIEPTRNEIQEALAEWFSQIPPYNDHFDASDVFFGGDDDECPEGLIYIQVKTHSP